MNQKIDRIKELRKDGFSIREISKQLTLSYSSVRKYSFGVEMTTEGKLKYSSTNGITKQITIDPRLSIEKVRIISNLLFDGAVYNVEYHYSIMYINGSRNLVDQFRNDMKIVYGVEPSSFEICQSNTSTYFRIKYLSKVIYEDLLTYFNTYSTSKENCLMPNWLLNADQNIKIIFLQAFFANEGSISVSGKLAADLKNKAIIFHLSKFCKDLGLKNYITRYYKQGWAYKLILNLSEENYQRFLELGLFSDAVVMKGFFKGMRKVDVLINYCSKRSWNIAQEPR